jgi:hypothetical protein
MKEITALFTFIAICTTALGQNPDVKYGIKWGMEEKVSKRLSLDDIVGYDESGFYALKISANSILNSLMTNRSSSFFLQHYNNDLKLDRLSKVDLNRRELERIVQIKDNLYLFSTLTENSDKNNSLFVQVIHKQNLKISADPVEIAKINYSGNRKRNSGEFLFRLSRDSSKLFVLGMLPFEKNENEKMALKVFDENMQIIWHKDVELPYTDELFLLKDLKVDNQGNVYLLGKVFHDKPKSKVGGAPNYHFVILSYKNKDGSFKEYPVSLKDKFLQEMQISIAENEDIICAGFYSEEGKSGIKGAYYLTVNGETNEVMHKSFKDFEIEFIVQDMTAKNRKKLEKSAEKGKNVEMYNYDLKSIILKEDGGAVLVAEQYFYRVQTRTYMTANGMMRTTTNVYYYFNDIIVVNIDGEGDILWANKIPKRQTTANDGGYFSSYTMAVVHDKLYFVFNDNIKNLTIEKEGKLSLFIGAKSAIAVLVEVNMDGTINKRSLFTTRDAGALTRPKVCEQVSGHEVVIFCESRKKHRFAKLDFHVEPKQLGL